MKIEADWEGRDDEWSNTPDHKITVRFWEDPNKKNGYYYELYVMVDNRKAIIFITPDGVSIDFKDDGSCIFYALIPSEIFPELETLKWKHLHAIIKLLKQAKFEKCSKDQMSDLYQKWLARN